MRHPNYLTEDEWYTYQLGYYSPDDLTVKSFDWWMDAIGPKGRPARHAIDLLSRLMFFERPYAVRLVNGRTIGLFTRCIDGYVKYSLDRWSKMLHCSVSSVQRAINLLVSIGLVHKDERKWTTEAHRSEPVALKVVPSRVEELLGTFDNPKNPNGTMEVEYDINMGVSPLEFEAFIASHPVPEWYTDPLVKMNNGSEKPQVGAIGHFEQGDGQNDQHKNVGHFEQHKLKGTEPVVDTKTVGTTREEEKNKQTKGGGGRRKGLGEVREELESTPLENLSEDEFSSLWKEIVKLWQFERSRNRMPDPISPLTMSMQRAYMRPPIDLVYGAFGDDGRRMVLAIVERSLECQDPKLRSKYLERVSFTLSGFADCLDFGDVDYWKGVYL